MGAAKRRKRAGAYPEGGPVKEFRVPRGKLAITVDVPGTDPSTILFDTDKIAAVVEAVERQPGRPSYRDLVMALAKEFAACKRRGGDLAGIGVGILWSVLNHPQSGSAMRASVSSALRERDCAHITWRLSNAGLAIALAGQFVDLGNAMAAAPKDRVVTGWRRTGDDPRLQ